jgi:hypothetical protein
MTLNPSRLARRDAHDSIVPEYAITEVVAAATRPVTQRAPKMSDLALSRGVARINSAVPIPARMLSAKQKTSNQRPGARKRS